MSKVLWKEQEEKTKELNSVGRCFYFSSSDIKLKLSIGFRSFVSQKVEVWLYRFIRHYSRFKS